MPTKIAGLILVLIFPLGVYGGPQEKITIKVAGRLLIDAQVGGVTTGEDGLTKVVIPPFALPRDAYVIINMDPLNNPKEVDPNQIIEAHKLDDIDLSWNRIDGSLREFAAYDSQGKCLSDNLKGAVVIMIPYSDADQDGLVDGLSPPVDETTLCIHALHQGRWRRIEEVGGRQSPIDTIGNTVSAIIPHFSVYIIMGRPALPHHIGSVAVWPNPFRPDGEDQRIWFGHPHNWRERLTNPATIRIYNIAGELVRTIREPEDDGEPDGIARWSGDNDDGQPLASGVYIYIIEDQKGGRCSGKIAIIR